ncbi:Uncharacterized protein BM_BM14265 [Brugia malayi]|uniref:Bm14265 n=1 Tax=Brugia malayi TaxID=6279 RepID=A0A0K0J0P6_BRUMA|nr:Uncharacterized protein BM_BM14265 [Brugia malayi]CDP99702.1 Bm14265 [Brugia malayi]VIO91835.1 Uncharacterized protein BM_BM14265 [Brugia malayi]
MDSPWLIDDASGLSNLQNAMYDAHKTVYNENGHQAVSYTTSLENDSKFTDIQKTSIELTSDQLHFLDYR